MTAPSPPVERRQTRAPRVMYVQYTNPAAYPPLEHSASILAAAGCEVRLVGTGAANEPLRFQQSDRVRVALMPFEPAGWRQKLHYAQFANWVAGEARQWQPDWVYVSDPLACPAALALRPLVDARFIYHEHDSPAEDTGAHSAFMRVVLRARRALAARAELCVLPNAERAELFRQQTGRKRDVVTVWNCPMRGEVGIERALPPTPGLRVLYHGSIVPARLPRTVLPALASLPDTVSLDVAGYETAGHPGYVESLRREADSLGVAARVTFVGTLPTRDELMRQCQTCDVGMALLPITSEDVNERAMVGASNKVFDYLACGLAVLVGNMPVWRETFAEAGFGRTCDPASPESVATALRWLLEHPDERVAMGRRGRQRVAADWNYEHQFAPVLARIV
ncbi:MAG TPA: glycosyltransferase [Vicinamibacterales bacterium]|nr:glycosyltransferase [Vicinamibacterales bacterium]